MSLLARTATLTALAVAATVGSSVALAQGDHSPPNTPNLHVVGRLDADRPGLTYTDIEIEQDPSRPYVYLSRVMAPNFGFDIVSLADPAAPRRLYSWRIENPELHTAMGGMDAKYFKHRGRYYYIQSFQFRSGGPDVDLGAIIFDVTGLPDTTQVREVARIRTPDTPGGFHNIFAYKHSDGRALLFATVRGRHANVYDLGKAIAGDSTDGYIGEIPWPSTAPDMTPYGPLEGYHDFYVAYDPNTGQDKLYGAGFNGYYIYDVTHPESPTLITSIVGVLGLQIAHTLTASPDGRFAVGQTEYNYSPVRLYDLRPARDDSAAVISHEIGAWTENWRGISHNNEMRWPYVFVSAYKDGVQVFDMRDPANPQTVALFDTYQGPPDAGIGPGGQDENGVGESPFNGAFGIDVRNSDGLIVASDIASGLWVFRLDGFTGWDGRDWNMPNISSVQDWDHGPKVVVP